MTIVCQAEGMRKRVTLVNGKMRIIRIENREQIHVARMWRI